MYCFQNDYSEGAHPDVLAALVQTNGEATCGYGLDPYCAQAADAIRSRFACPDAAVHFFVGGTQTNATVLSAFLRPWECAIAAQTAHINVHEAGAVEARGHKIYAVPTPDGKLTPELIEQAVRSHQTGTEEHMVLPRLVYLSNSTELGTIYTRAELTAISAVCRQQNLLLYLDGARLAQALTAAGNDLQPEDFAQLCDAFYIGGTKNGALFGEALVIVNPALQPYFRNMMKQNGGMLAKGRLLGVQFLALLRNDLWLTLGDRANAMAQRLSQGIQAAGYPLYAISPTNQVFFVLPKPLIAQLAQQFTFECMGHADQTHDVVRFVTSWATSSEAVDALLAALPAAKGGPV